MPEKILIVDDDRKILNVVKTFLTRSGLTVVATNDPSDALLLARDSRPDLLLTDADMPGLGGHALCRLLKKDEATKGIPVILMSGALIDDRDVVAGLEGGADDYIMKPFSLAVLLARIKTVLKRYAASADDKGSLKRRGLELDPGARSVKVSGKPVSLTRKEFDLLATLIGKPGKVLSVPYLLETVWGYDPADYNDPGTVEVHVSHLRKKLGPKLGRLIVNLVGNGYKFDL